MAWIVRRTRFLNTLNQLNNKMLPNRTFTQYIKLNSSICSCVINKSSIYVKPNLEIYRYKHNKKSKKQNLTESDEGENTDDFDDEIQDKQTKLMSVKVNSLRADVILKAGLGIARNKIEIMFYESKIRVNGKKLLKKSTMLNVGDEIDIVKGANVQNPEFLTVARVEILAASERGEGLNVKLRRNKSLAIEHYDI